jgi:hypothetical protein
MSCEALENTNYAQCDTRKLVVCKQKGKKYKLENNISSKICKVKVDGGLIQDNTQRCCDFLVILCDTNTFIFVELKGNHVNDACFQILSTIKRLKSQISSPIYARIVAQSVPNTPTSNEIKLKQELMKLNGNEKIDVEKLIKKKSIYLTEKASDLV